MTFLVKTGIGNGFYTPKNIKKEVLHDLWFFWTDEKHTFLHFGPPFFKKGPLTPWIYDLYSATSRILIEGFNTDWKITGSMSTKGGARALLAHFGVVVYSHDAIYIIICVVCLFVCLCVCVFVCLFVCLSVHSDLQGLRS